MLLQGPVLPTLLRLVAPNMLIFVVNSLTTACDAYFVGQLGTDALAGLALVFPVMTLMAACAIGGIGGGAGAAVARALGAGHPETAETLVTHALVTALIIGVGFTAGMLLAGPALYTALGGMGASLHAALAFSNVLFGGAVVSWLFNILVAVVRGSGNMWLPAVVIVTGGSLHIGLSRWLVLGSAWLSPLGIQGIAISYITYHGLGTLVLCSYLLSGRGFVGLSFDKALSGVHFWEILRVGVPASTNFVLGYLTVIIVTGLVGHFGSAAVAAYGLSARLEYIQGGLVSNIGLALIVFVGANTGRGNYPRARRVAWVGAALATTLTSGFGLLAAVCPWLWIGLFTAEPEVIATASTYFRVVAPTYPAYGLGLALYFAVQGMGHGAWAAAAGVVRFLIAAGAGAVTIYGFTAPLTTLFAMIALSFLAFGCTLALALTTGRIDAIERRHIATPDPQP